MIVLAFPVSKKKLFNIDYLLKRSFKDLQEYCGLENIPAYKIETVNKNCSRLLIYNEKEDYKLFMSFFLGFDFTRSISFVFDREE